MRTPNLQSIQLVEGGQIVEEEEEEKSRKLNFRKGQ